MQVKEFLFALIYCLLPLFLWGHQPAQIKTEPSPVIKKKIEQYLLKLEELGFSGTVLVDKEGQKLLSKGYGWSDREMQFKNEPNTVFDIGSITKQFTAAGILKLEMKGLLSVQDKINQYFEQIPKDKASITIHQLLTHSAGLPSAIGDDYEKISEKSFLDRAFQSKLLSTPGEIHEYSNVGYSLLALIIEKVTGKSYEQFLYENLWKPSDMEMTGYTRPDFSKKQVAVGYHSNGKPWGQPNEQNWDEDAPFLNLKGNGGILSTTEDLYKWHKVLKTNKVLSSDAIEKYVTPYIKEDLGATSHYGYGWAIFRTARNTKLAAHNGGNDIFFADFWRYLDDDVSIIMMCNSASPYAEIIASQIGAIIFLPDFEPTFPSQNNMDDLTKFDQESISDFAKSALLVFTSENKNDWEEFIINQGTKEFISIVPMDTHLEYFSKFHQKLKDGTLKDIQQEGDEFIVSVKTPNGMVDLILVVEKDEKGALKLGGAMVE